MLEFSSVSQLMFDGSKNKGGSDVPQLVTKHANLHIEECVLLPNTVTTSSQKAISGSSEEGNSENSELINPHFFSLVTIQLMSKTQY